MSWTDRHASSWTYLSLKYPVSWTDRHATSWTYLSLVYTVFETDRHATSWIYLSRIICPELTDTLVAGLTCHWSILCPELTDTLLTGPTCHWSILCPELTDGCQNCCLARIRCLCRILKKSSFFVWFQVLTLLWIGVFFTLIFYGEGGDSFHLIFTYEKNKKSNFLEKIFLHVKILPNFLTYLHSLGVP